jgi:methylphosphotriester-DNA--protein-cysteine methyltransferase
MNQAIFRSVFDTVVRRETKYDGIYYTGIKTTGIVCRLLQIENSQKRKCNYCLKV